MYWQRLYNHPQLTHWIIAVGMVTGTDWGPRTRVTWVRVFCWSTQFGANIDPQTLIFINYVMYVTRMCNDRVYWPTWSCYSELPFSARLFGSLFLCHFAPLNLSVIINAGRFCIGAVCGSSLRVMMARGTLGICTVIQRYCVRLLTDGWIDWQDSIGSGDVQLTGTLHL